MNRLTTLGLLVCAVFACVPKVDAQPVTTLYSFVRGPLNPYASLTLGNDGNFYGTTAAGGKNLGGTVFRMATNGALTTLYQFNGYPAGSAPRADLTLGFDGFFYGTTSTGGTNLSGTDSGGVVFRMTTNGLPTTVVNFNGTNGGSPQAAVILGPDGFYYGTTRNGSTNGNGTVFKVSTNGILTTLVYFNGANGANPVSCLTLAPGGTFYGTTKAGGQFGGGTAFKLTTNGDFTTLHNFEEQTVLSGTEQNTEGAAPDGRMALGPDGNLYGTTLFPGSAFQMTTNGVVTTLYNFDVPTSGTNGEFPYSGLTLGPDGNFYGTTSQGGTNGTGTIFQVSTNGILATLNRLPGIQYQYVTNSQNFVLIYYSTNNFATSTFAGTTGSRFLNGVLTFLYSFSALTNSDNSDGADPESGLTVGPDGQLYGTTVGGGTNGAGTVFKISTNGTFTALASFAGNTGYNPYAGVTPGPGGSLYGVVKSGGTTGYGTAYKVSSGGQFTLLDNFSYFTTGANPQASLIQGPNGNFYGTASGGGTNLLQTGPSSYQAESFGTVFELATNGALTMLAYFAGTNGANPYGRLAIGLDGNFYGTTAYGGLSNNGVVFQLLTNGTLTALTNFTGVNGANPYEGLTLGPDGNFYGTTEAGGSSNNGTVFQVTPAGALKTLVYFDGTNGANPNDALVLGRDGNLYGTTYTTTPDSGGTLFRVTPGGTFTSLYSFVRTNFVFTHGQHPVGGLAQGPDGCLYGTTSLGGVNNGSGGTLFKITTNGTLTTLYSFLIPNGSAPFATLTLQTNSHFINFYGTTLGDGGDHPGTVYRVNLTTSYAIAENTAQTFSPLTNEVVWTTGGSLGLLTAVATNGTAQISGPDIGFTPATNFTGTATISYTVTDNAGGTNASFITILVTNIPPAANPDFYTVAENSAANVFSPLVNDLPNTSGGVLSLVSVSATNGTAVISGTNILFTPTLNFTGTATIGYVITDNIGGTNTSLITVTVANSSVDLSLSATESPNPINASNLLTYTFIVSNAGPATATDVTVSNQLFTAGSQFTFNSATGGGTPTNGILLINLGSLAPGATNVAQMTAYVRTGVQSISYFTNTFQVYADQADPSPANNFATVTVEATNAAVAFFTSSTAEYDTTNTTTVSQQVTNYTTELIAKLPDGTVVYDQTFTAAFSNVTVQAAIATAAVDLTNAGASAYTGPAQSSFLKTTNNSSATVNGGTNINVIVGVKQWVGPVTFAGGDFGVVTGYTFDAVITNYAIPTGGNPQTTTLTAGETDTDTRVLSLFDFLQTTTNTVTYANSSVYVMTGIVAQADLKLTASAAPEPVGVNSNLVYSLVITNGGPSAAAGLVVSNQLPAGITFVSATGGATPSGGVLLLNLGSLAIGAVTNVQVIVQPTLAGRLTNLFQLFASTTDPVLTNNFAPVISTVTNVTIVPPPVDVAVSITSAPNPVAVGAPLTYSLTVTNNSLTTANGVTVSNTLPPNVTFNSALPSQGSATNQSGIVMYSVGSLPNGTAATLAIVVIPNAAGLLTNIATASSTQTDSQPANNRATNITTVVNGAITNLVLTVLSGITLNPQTGLFEQRIQVSNGGPATPSSVLVLISGLAANAHLYNATGTTNGTPYVQSSSPLGVGSNIVFLLEYYVPTRVAPANLTLTVQAGPVMIPPVINGTILNIDRTIVRDDGSVLVEFSTVPGQIYTVQYSSDMITWRTAVPAITAPTSRVQWIDAGPPKTDSNPAGQPARYYRAVLLPAH
ncbi:MAG: Ig-like domain-containing protein [Verrucomicrobiae bacterium]|nr:Ig-like domain-containing protein [Verrucomicrobiae bacterium]